MSGAPRTEEFSEAFMQAVHQVDAYFQTRNPARGQRFVQELFALLYNVVIPFPQSQPLFAPLGAAFPGREFRRVLFRRQYVAVYEVSADKIRFLLFRHSSFDPEGGYEELLNELG